MPTINITKDELTILNDALEASVASATRQQNMKGKTPMIIEVYKKHEITLRALQTKINEAK